MRSIIAYLLLTLGSLSVKSQPFPAVLQSGLWAKFSVSTDGIYKIDYNLLRKAGFDPDKIDPRNIQIFTAGPGMLPQANDAPRLNELTQTAIYVEGESDGVFNSSDYILFYGQGPDQTTYDLDRKLFSYSHHLYADANFYFITVSPTNGLRLSNAANQSGSFPLVTTFNDYSVHELDAHNELKSGREWFGENFDLNPTWSIAFSVPGIVSSSEIKVVSSVMAQAFNPSSFQLFINGSLVGEQPVAPIPNTQYGVKGRVVTDTLIVNADQVNAASQDNQEVKYQYIKANSGKSIGYLNYVLMSYERKLKLYGTQTRFVAGESAKNTTSTFVIEGLPPDAWVWNVTNPFSCAQQAFSLSGSTASFSCSTSDLQYFIAFSGQDIPGPDLVGPVANQHITEGAANLIIVSAEELLTEANRLAEHRRSFQSLMVKVVTPQQIFNEFSGGKQDPTAIRDFVRYMYLNTGQKLKNVLLMGRCSYDYKDRIPNNTNLVPTYESRNSLSPLETYSSDDYYGLLDVNEGAWPEDFTDAPNLDVGVGRLPVKSIEEAKSIVDKLISYDVNKQSVGAWRKTIAFVADDGDFNLHQSDADKMAVAIDTTQHDFDVKKIYLDAYPQISQPNGQRSPEARKALLNLLDKGALIVNFTGHGSEYVWMDERILDEDLIREWKNEHSFPLLITATCEFGRHDDPAQNSSSIQSIIKSNGGSIGLVTAARPVSAFTNATLNRAFYEALFTLDNGSYRDLGAIFRDTKNNSLSGVGNRNFSLLADPSMRLAIPLRKAEISKLQTQTNSDTLKALSHVILEGEIQQAGNRDYAYNGAVLVEMDDKAFNFETLGDENPVFTYAKRSNVLFRGQATVDQGAFHVEFMLPKNIGYQIGKGKVSLYAYNSTLNDAAGGSQDFSIGGSEPNASQDLQGPDIQVFMGDTTFIDGGIVSANTQLVARLFDVNGINISTYGIGNHLVAVLDDTISYELSEFFLADRDNFQKGTVTLPLSGLTAGRHFMKVLAWDTYNNPASAGVDFVVTEGSQLQIEEVINSPNPFYESTLISFAHNRAGEDLDVICDIFDMAGQEVRILNFSVETSPYWVTLGAWDGTNTLGTKMHNGIYLLRLTVRSKVDGSKNAKIAKLIILN